MKKITQILKLFLCKEAKDETIPEEFKDFLDSTSFTNMFNPSFYIDDEVQVLSFRAIPNGENKASSFVIIKDKEEQIMINISEKFSQKFHVDQLIDPKVTKLHDGIYITFNSGWNPKGNNDIFIMKVYPEIQSPKRVVFNQRKGQERNWAFFSEGTEIYMLYWINPLRILRLERETEDFWEFKNHYSADTGVKWISKDLTLGTQLFRKENKYYFMAHKKILILGKKIYSGRFCSLDFENKKIVVGKKRIVHSLKSLFGSKIKHNKNLISCTYFSGLQIFDDSVILGYGVNDIEAGFSKHKIKELMD